MNAMKETEKYVTDHPSIKDALSKGLINYSKLSRKIISDTGMKNREFDAVLVSLRRIGQNLSKKQVFERDLRSLMSGSKIELKNKMMVYILEKNVLDSNLADFQKEVRSRRGQVHIVEGVDAITMIVSEEFEKQAEKQFKKRIIKKNKDLVEIIIRSSEQLEDVPGYMGYLCSLFADKGINIVEISSCWTDTIIVIDKKDVEKTIDMLNF